MTERKAKAKQFNEGSPVDRQPSIRGAFRKSGFFMDNGNETSVCLTAPGYPVAENLRIQGQQGPHKPCVAACQE
jgi:hypothetical protein